ncbi:copper resistance protein C [Rhodococcoides trifolii]|uniref:Copper resistance protein C n=1 Tax=Rhodococcoides trifolii TaxID=908250 RepID=A0A917CKR8_9NOCA|nr:copper resistance CopC family protein [Rhodococcus trifolii]GGF90760.1 copper resistance protein C [Rhodococcus trifolii]
MKRLAALIVGVLAALTLSVGTASAHSVAVSSTPENASSVDTGPAQASVTFNEAIQSQFASLTVVGPDGNLWSRSDPTVSGATVSVDVGDLGPTGTYTIAYRVTSADGHPVSGTRTFDLTAAGSGTPGPAADADAASDSSAGGVPLWPFLVAAVVVFAGGLFFALRKKA